LFFDGKAIDGGDAIYEGARGRNTCARRGEENTKSSYRGEPPWTGGLGSGSDFHETAVREVDYR